MKEANDPTTSSTSGKFCAAQLQRSSETLERFRNLYDKQNVYPQKENNNEKND